MSSDITTSREKKLTWLISKSIDSLHPHVSQWRELIVASANNNIAFRQSRSMIIIVVVSSSCSSHGVDGAAAVALVRWLESYYGIYHYLEKSLVGRNRMAKERELHWGIAFLPRPRRRGERSNFRLNLREEKVKWWELLSCFSWRGAKVSRCWVTMKSSTMTGHAYHHEKSSTDNK